MKKTRTRALPVLLLTITFFIGIAYFVFNLSIHAAEWASMPINGHLSDSSGLENAGKIIDRNGTVLAESIDGQRVYNDDYSVRCACLPVVGDNSINNSTAVQTIYRSELSGYNFIFGLGLPDSMKSGKDITLTIDSNIQTAAYEALGDNKGAAVLFNYKTGEILCLASTPAYDPMNKPGDIETNDKYEGAYINRAVSASYPPGSTFKLVTAAAALENMDNVEEREFDCDGSTEIGGQVINCFEVNGHVDLRDAIKTSCNGYFAHLAVDLGKDAMKTQADKMGFNHSWKIDGIETMQSSYDVSKADENELGWSGVGQYKVLETPVNMAIRSAAIANGGTPVKPMLIKNISESFGIQTPDNVSKKTKSMMSKETADKLSEMMKYTVDNNYGNSVFGGYFSVCAKTGTAEVSDSGLDAHGWVTGFTTDEDCPLAFSVIVEHGNSGYTAAIPVAAAMLHAAANSYQQ